MFLTKYRPKNDIDTIFDSFGRGFLPAIQAWTGEGEEMFRHPRTNLNETDDAFVVTIEMPGVDKKNVDVSVDGDQLVVTGERTEKLEDEGLLRREIRSEKFRRSFGIGNTIDRDAIKAKIDNGILKVTLPKTAKSVGKKIAID